jgi:hypothetical protein
MAGVVHIPWYATLFRGDRFAAAIAEPAAAALRYNATRYTVHRSRDDAYRFDHMIWFEDKLDWLRYWEGPEMSHFRASYSGWYQVPVLYYWSDEIVFDSIEEEGAKAEAETPVESA